MFNFIFLDNLHGLLDEYETDQKRGVLIEQSNGSVADTVDGR